MAREDFYEFSDLLGHATSIGYDWNQAHDILVDDNIPPMYECPTNTFYYSDLDQYGWSEDTVKILKSFFESEEITKFIMSR